MLTFKLNKKKPNNNLNNEGKEISDGCSQEYKKHRVSFQRVRDKTQYWKFTDAIMTSFIMAAILFFSDHLEVNPILNNAATVNNIAISTGEDLAFLSLDDASNMTLDKSRFFKSSNGKKSVSSKASKDSINTRASSELSSALVSTSLIKSKLLITNGLMPKNLFQDEQPKDSVQTRKILIIADEWPQMQFLAQSLEETGRFKIEFRDQKNVESGLKDYDAVFMYIHAIMKKRTENLLIKYTKRGGRLIVLHHGIASSKISNPKWLKFVGIELYPRDSPQYAWKVLPDTTHAMVNLAPGNYITTNKVNYTRKINYSTDYSDSISGTYDAFDLTKTEVFMNQRFVDIQQKNILYGFAAVNDSIMQPTSGWYEKKGNGWLFYFQAGHELSDYRNKNFMQVLINTLEWK